MKEKEAKRAQAPSSNSFPRFKPTPFFYFCSAVRALTSARKSKLNTYISIYFATHQASKGRNETAGVCPLLEKEEWSIYYLPWKLRLCRPEVEKTMGFPIPVSRTGESSQETVVTESASLNIWLPSMKHLQYLLFSPTLMIKVVPNHHGYWTGDSSLSWLSISSLTVHQATLISDNWIV